MKDTDNKDWNVINDGAYGQVFEKKDGSVIITATWDGKGFKYTSHYPPKPLNEDTVASYDGVYFKTKQGARLYTQKEVDDMIKEACKEKDKYGWGISIPTDIARNPDGSPKYANLPKTRWFTEEAYQKEVDAIREEAFGSGYFKGWYNGCFEKDKKMSNEITKKAYQSYLQSLTKDKEVDTGKPFDEKEYEEEKFKRMKKATEQPINDKAFVWTEELAIHFAIELRNCKEINHKEHKSWRDSLAEFKQRILSEFPETQNQKSDTGKYSKEWEIVQFSQKDGSTLWVGKNIYGCWYIYDKVLRRNFDRDEKWMIENGYPIHSVKRLSDGIVLSVQQQTPTGIIRSFEIAGSDMIVNFENGVFSNINFVPKPKLSTGSNEWTPEPNAKTVTDNSDVPCLSISDLKEIDHAGNGNVLCIVMDKLKKKVNQKLKTHTP